MRSIVRLGVFLGFVACGSDDLPAKTPDASSAIDGPIPPPGKRVFITSMNTNAALKSIGGAATGVASADVMCNNTAAASGVTGTWTAWISDTNVDAIDRITGAGPWFRMDGQMAFLNKANLTTHPLIPIVIDETGTTLHFPPDLINTWTGTGAGGRYSPATNSTCTDWTLTAGKGTVGDAGEIDGGWSDFDLLDCDLMGRLYCVEN